MREGAFELQFEDDADLERGREWVARFAPLLDDDPALTTGQIHERLKSIDQLAFSAPDAVTALRRSQSSESPALLSTIEKAATQLKSLETDLRRRLANAQPGHPRAIPNLEAINAELSERAAEQEIGLADDVTKGPLELETSDSNWGGAFGLFVFGLGWTAFTTVHAFFMIGGMFKAFGAIALALLLFYSIFYLVGFAMLGGAVMTAAKESIRLVGCDLTVIRKLGPLRWERRYALDVNTTASVGVDHFSSRPRSQGAPKLRSVLIEQDNGKRIALATGTSERRRQEIAAKITAYLRAQK